MNETDPAQRQSKVGDVHVRNGGGWVVRARRRSVLSKGRIYKKNKKGWPMQHTKGQSIDGSVG